VLFALQPKYTNVDMRVFIDVTEGELDVFLSTSDRVFTVRLVMDELYAMKRSRC